MRSTVHFLGIKSANVWACLWPAGNIGKGPPSLRRFFFWDARSQKKKVVGRPGLFMQIGGLPKSAIKERILRRGAQDAPWLAPCQCWRLCA